MSHLETALLFLLLFGFVTLNILAYRHAHAMTHFSRGVRAQTKPEALSRLGKLKALFWGVQVPRPVLHSTPATVGLPYETLHIDGANARLEAWYVPHSAERGLVLLFHGYARCKADLIAETLGFHELGYACLLVDFPGSGGSEGAVTTIGYREADDVVRCVAVARQRWPGRRLILFGQSMGGAASLRALGVHKLVVDAVILECPFDRLLSTVKARFRAMGLPGTPGAQLLLLWGAWQNGFSPFAHNPVEYARNVTCPVLLLHGSNDTRVTSAHIAGVFQNLAGPKRLHVFDGLGHDSYAKYRPTEWKEVVAAFLAQQPSDATGARTDVHADTKV